MIGSRRLKHHEANRYCSLPRVPTDHGAMPSRVYKSPGLPGRLILPADTVPAHDVHSCLTNQDLAVAAVCFDRFLGVLNIDMISRRSERTFQRSLHNTIR